MKRSHQIGFDAALNVRFTGKALRLGAAAAVLSALLCSQVASAGTPSPTLSAETKVASIDGDAAYAYGEFGSTGLMVKQIFIEGLQPGDAITSIFGDATNPGTIQTSAGSFFNSQLPASNGRPDPKLFADSPSLQWDTWLAVDDAELMLVLPFNLNIGLPNGGSNVSANDNLAWIPSPPGVGVVTATGRVLIGQFAFAEGADFEITVNVGIRRDNVPMEIRNLHYVYTPPEPTGACCVNGTCTEVTEDVCALMGAVTTAVFHGVGTHCSDVQCEAADPTGACCINGVCSALTEAVCIASNGVFSGAGTRCNSIKCDTTPPDLTGACCVGGECTVVTEAICSLLGSVTTSVFHGVGTTCEDVDCSTPPPPTEGACCVNGSCVQATEQICQLTGGTFNGVGTDCGSVRCETPPPAVGACCVMNECAQATEAACQMMGGTFHGVGVECGSILCGPPPGDPTGACCVSGQCVVVTEATCLDLGGTYAGDNTACDRNRCRNSRMPNISGCMSNYWRNPVRRTHDFSHWPGEYSPDTTLASVFTLPDCLTNAELRNGTLRSALNYHGGPGRDGAYCVLLREGAAALLNAQTTQNGACGMSYAIENPQTVISIINGALADCSRRKAAELAEILGRFNGRDCPCLTNNSGR